MPDRLAPELEERLLKFARSLVDDDAAVVLVEPTRNEPGFWFGSGGVARGADGAYYISGRYRDRGDSRTGLAAGRRGWKLAIKRSRNPLGPYEDVWTAEKNDLGTERGEVVSIEGTALLRREDGTVELYISSEKARPYPDAVKDAQKPNTGIWDIDLVAASDFDQFDPDCIRPLLWSDDPETLHIKDPDVTVGRDGETLLMFCHHGFNWSSSSTGLMRRRNDAWGAPEFNIMPHGLTWDVAVTRATSRLPIPPVGAFASQPPVSLYFYDGAECVREHPSSKPKGYSCEELGGAAYALDAKRPVFVRLSRLEPLFVSRRGTGCHRYVKTYIDSDGVMAMWQMSNEQAAQPLYGRYLPMAKVAEILD